MSKSVSFASVASATSTAAVSWPTDEHVDSHTLLTDFLKPYLIVHRLSLPSRRAAYLLWLAIAAIFVLWCLEHLLTKRHAGSFGCLRDKISMRRFYFTIGRTKVPKPGQKAAAKRLWTTPTVAQMVSMILMLAGITAACFWGNDYLNPSTCLFGGWCPGQNASPPKTTYTRARRLVRELEQPFVTPLPVVHQQQASGLLKVRRHASAVKRRDALLSSVVDLPAVGKRADLNANGYIPANDPLLAGYSYSIHRRLWTSSARIGMIATALCPLVVSLAMKIFPFAAFAVPKLMAYEFDKTVMYHRWIGIIIWILSTAHTVTWIMQLVQDKDPYGKPVLYDMIYYWHFYGACAAYVALTSMLVLSFSAIRARFYEFFYISHMTLAIVFLVGVMLHYPPLKSYLIISLGIWGGEKLTRLLWWLYLNGFFHGLNSSERQSQKLTKLHNQLNKTRRIGYPEKTPLMQVPATPLASTPLTPLTSEKSHYDSSSFKSRRGKRPPPILLYQVEEPTHFGNTAQFSPGVYPPNPPSIDHPGYSPLSALDEDRPTPPPGFALAQLLPGKNIRLTIRVPRVVHWRTGQYISLTIPSVNKLQGHPFTIANADEKQIHKVNQVGSEIVLIIGVRNGFTKRLWDEIVKRRKVFGPAAAASSGGILIRAQVGQPTGTAGRAKLDDFESVMIVCGGTGVSFGMAVMQHVCMSMAARETDRSPDNKKRKCKTQRVRFVWILREFAHLTWVAPAVRRCLEMCPPSHIRIDFFVTREAKKILPSNLDSLPPNPSFHQSHQRTDSDVSEDEDSGMKSTPLVQPEAASALDYVLFDGEDEEQTLAEMKWSAKVQQEGKLRRAKSRRVFTGKRHRPGRFGLGSSTNTPVGSPAKQRFSQVDLKSVKQDSLNIVPLPAATTDDLIDSYYSMDDSMQDSPDNSRSGSPVYERGCFSKTQESVASVRTHRTQASHMSHQSNLSFSSKKGLLDQSHASPFLDEQENLELDVSEAEMEALQIVSELARTGHPDIAKIMDEEQERAQGRLMVACCGPIKLNINIRQLVAERISPLRVARGDMRGSISLMVEDFE